MVALRTVRWAGIFAAGEGSRLQPGHPGLPKPLVPVCGKPLVHWALQSLRAAGVRSLLVLLNSRGGSVRSYLREHAQGMRISFLSRDTASSWESFRLLSRALARRTQRFLLSTADAVMPPGDAERFSREAFAPGREPVLAALALTRFVDDEKPLWVDMDGSGRVSALGRAAVRRDGVTCGLYAMTARAARRLPPAASHGRLRDFWAGLVSSGAPVRGVMLSDTVDVDRPRDIPAAERVIRCFNA